MSESGLLGQNTGIPKDGWAQSGELPGSGGLSPANSITLQADFPDSNNYTVQFGVVGPDESASSGERKTQAIITWAVEGNHITRRIDVVNGTSITGTAQGCHVEVVDLSFHVNPYTVSISIAKGSRPSVQQPPYLTPNPAFIALDPGGGAGAVLVPNDAGVISIKSEVVAELLGDHLNPDDIVVQFFASAVVLKQYSPLIETGWVPLPSGTTAVRYLSFFNAGTVGYLCYTTFGIDG